LRVGIVGAGTVGTDLLRRLEGRADIEVVLVTDCDAAAPGLALAAANGIATSADGVELFLAADDAPEVVFVATNATGHRGFGSRLADAGLRVVDLTPAAGGVVVVPTVNLDAADGAVEISLATPAAQAAVPFVAAIAEVAPVSYAEAVSTVASAGLGAGARRSVDEALDITAAALRQPGRAAIGKAIALVSPAEPPPTTRVSVFCLVAAESDRAAVAAAVVSAADSLTARAPGCRLAAEPLFEETDDAQLRTSIMIEATAAAGGGLPSHAGHVELLTLAAIEVGERLACGPLAVG
jgi:acetaldehyde dehydrogenase